jgi:hypothetical protein
VSAETLIRADPPPPRPSRITLPLLLRVAGVATLVSLFFALLAPGGSDEIPLVRRVPMFVGYGWLGAGLGIAAVRVAYRLGVWRRGWAVAAGASGLLMTLPMWLIVWLLIWLTIGRPLPLSGLPQMLWQTALYCVGMSYFALALTWRRGAAPAEAAGPPKFLDRIPFKLRGGELWAVEAQDHYLRLHTSKGQDLILMRLADAIDELEGIEGAQVHRSWWVARDAVTEARRGDGRAVLTLKDGSEVPVSRTYARHLRERRWI